MDLAAKRVSAGRSVITSGRFARADELKRWASQPFAYDLASRSTPITPPVVLNPLSIRAFNEAWNPRAARRPRRSST